MRIIIINLDSAPERLHFQKWQMSHFGLEFERLKAVSVDELPRSLSERYWSTWERPLRRRQPMYIAPIPTFYAPIPTF